MSKSPVFIVGSPRSGTSILVKSLVDVGYHGYNEGNFLPLLHVIDRTIDNHFEVFGRPDRKTLTAQVDRLKLKGMIEDVFKTVTDGIYDQQPLWFDKTGHGEMIPLIPTLRRLWPESVFIFSKRRAIENVLSRVKKFPKQNFERHCSGWGRTMTAWRQIRDVLPRELYLEVDQQDLIRNTEEIAGKIAQLLKLSPEQARILVKDFTNKRPQETSKGSASATRALESTGWTDAQMAIFEKHCGPEMRAYGYGTGADYYLETNAVAKAVG